MQELGPLLPIIGIALLFWLLIIRPQSKRQKAVQLMQSGLEPGNEVMLTSGIFGTIEQVEDDALRVRVADGVTLRVVKGAVGNVVTPNAEASPSPDPDDEAPEDPAQPPRDV